MGKIGIIFGASYGLIMAAIFSPKLISGELVDDTWVRFCLRFVVTIMLTLPWRYMTTLINMASLKNVYLTLWFG